MAVRNEQGSVLLLVLLMVSLLCVVVLDGVRTGQLDWEGAAGFRASLQAESLALSGEQLARGVLEQDSALRDWQGEDWAGLESAVDQAEVFTSGRLRLRIVDEAGRFPLRRADRHTNVTDVQVLERLVKLTGFTGDAQAYARAVVDWQDLDEVYASGGSEAGAYTLKDGQSGVKSAPNRRMRSISELLLLRWKDMKPGEAELAYYGAKGHWGMKDLCTVYAPMLNVNTMLPEVAAALVPPPGDGWAFARSVLQRRSGKDVQSSWYAPLFASYKVTYPVNEQSSFFRVESVGEVGAVKVHMVAVLHRERKNIQRVYREVW